MGTYVIGIDVGGTSVKMGLFDKGGRLICKWSIPTDRSDGGIHILPDIALSVKKQLADKKISLSEAAGAGIGLPGPVMGSQTVYGCPNLGWGRVNAAAQLSAALDGMKTAAVNDANAATLGEMWQGSGKGCSSLVMVTLGTGVGSGVIIGGQIVEGAFGAAGEIGHMCMNPQETRLCGCGKRGHLEQYASATGIVRETRAALESSSQPSVLRELSDFDAKAIFDAARAGDAFALSRVKELADVLGRALAAVSCVLDPQVFLLGGGVSGAGEFLSSAVQDSYRHYAFSGTEETPVRIAALGADAGIYGAAKLVLGEE